MSAAPFPNLPPALKEQEIIALLIKVKNEHCSISRDKAIEHNLRLVAYIAQKFKDTKVLTEDAFSIGSIGLIKAVNTFDPEKKIRFATYASRCIENEILMNLRKQKKINKETLLDTPVSADEIGNALTIADIIASPDRNDGEQLMDDADRDLAGLIMEEFKLIAPKRCVDVLELVVVNGMTQADASHIMNVAQSYVSRLERQAMKILQKARNNVAKRLAAQEDEAYKQSKAAQKSKSRGIVIDMTIPNNPQWAGKVVWLRENTKLSQASIGEIVGKSQFSVWQVLKRYAEGVDITPDESARELYKKYLEENSSDAKHSSEETAQVTMEKLEETQEEAQEEAHERPEEQKKESDTAGAEAFVVSYSARGISVELKHANGDDVYQAINQVISAIKAKRLYTFSISIEEVSS